MTDLHGLFNCLRPDPPEGYGVFDDHGTEEYECAICPNKATRKVTYFKEDKFTTITVCDECYLYEDELWEGRNLIKTTHL